MNLYLHKQKILKYYLAAILAYAIWGFFSLGLKPIETYPALDILFYRVFSCAVIMSLVSIFFKRKKIVENINLFKSKPKNERKVVIWLNIGGSIFLTANWFSFIYVMNHISVSATSVAYLICPILTTLLAYFLLSEKLNRLQWLSVLLSCIGCLLLSYTSIITMIFSAIIGLTFACYLISQNKNSGFDKFLVLNFHVVLSALILAPFYPYFSATVPTQFKFYFYIEIIAVIYTIVPLFLNLYALSGIGSSKVGTIVNINPMIAFILAGLVYHEPFGGLQSLSYLLILVAVILFNVSQDFKFGIKKVTE